MLDVNDETIELSKLLTLDSFQLLNLISNLHFYKIESIFLRNTNHKHVLLIYYRLPIYARRRILKSSNEIKSIIRNYENKYSIAIRLEPVAIFNISDLCPSSMALKIRHHNHLLDFFLKDFIVLQDEQGKYKGILYLQDIIKIIHDKNFGISIIPRIIFNKTLKSSEIKNTINDEDQLVYYNHFVVVNTEDQAISALDVDDVLDDYYLVQGKSEIINHVFCIRKKQKLLNTMFILASVIFSTCLISCVAVMFHFHTNIIVISDILSSVNDGVVMVSAQDELEFKEIILYSCLLNLLIQTTFFIIYIVSGYLIMKSLLIVLLGASCSIISMFIILLFSHLRYNISIPILITDIILIINMFILKKIL
jgi:hypothetical protein